MAMNAPGDQTEAYRRAGDMMSVEFLAELRYLRQRMDTVIDGMAKATDVAALSHRMDAEVRALESRIDTQRTEMGAQRASLENKIDTERATTDTALKNLQTSVDALKRDKLPPWFWPSAVAIVSLASVIGGFFMHHP